MKLTIQYIRQQLGGRCRVIHSRYVYESPLLRKNTNLLSMKTIRELGAQEFILPKGGLTKIEITLNNKDYVVEAACSKKDAFSRKFALNLCMERFGKVLEQEKLASN